VVPFLSASLPTLVSFRSPADCGLEAFFYLSRNSRPSARLALDALRRSLSAKPWSSTRAWIPTPGLATSRASTARSSSWATLVCCFLHSQIISLHLLQVSARRVCSNGIRRTSSIQRTRLLRAVRFLLRRRCVPVYCPVGAGSLPPGVRQRPQGTVAIVGYGGPGAVPEHGAPVMSILPTGISTHVSLPRPPCIIEVGNRSILATHPLKFLGSLGANAALLLYDITNASTFDDIRGWLEGVSIPYFISPSLNTSAFQN
jgi:hypothetical protein